MFTREATAPANAKANAEAEAAPNNQRQRQEEEGAAWRDRRWLSEQGALVHPQGMGEDDLWAILEPKWPRDAKWSDGWCADPPTLPEATSTMNVPPHNFRNC